MRTRLVLVPVVLVSWMSCMAAPGHAGSFDDWQKKDQEAFRAFKQPQHPPPSAGTMPADASASRTGTSRPLDTMPELVPSSLPVDVGADTNDIPDGDEMEPVISPAGTVTTVAKDAGWGCHLSSDPGKLLDALEGGRPGGDVNAMMALLRQTQGPFTEEQDQAMVKKYAPYAASGSAKAHKAIRQQNELLLRSMMHRLMMMQAAWEYDFALAQAEIAKRMQDTEEMEVALQLAENQRQAIQEQQTALEKVASDTGQCERLPTLAELKAEEDAERTNAVTALELPASGPSVRKVLMGYLKYEEVHLWKAPGTGITEGMWGVEKYKVDVGENSASLYQAFRPRPVYEGDQVVKTLEIVISYTCTWDLPKLIPLYAEVVETAYPDCHVNSVVTNVIRTIVPWRVEVVDTGSRNDYTHENQHRFTVGVTVNTVTRDQVALDPNEPAGGGFGLEFAVSGEPLSVDTLNASSAGTCFPWHYVAPNKVDSLSTYWTFPNMDPYMYFAVADQSQGWKVCARYKWEPAGPDAPAPSEPDDPNLDQEKNDAIAEHRGYIAAAERVIKSIVNEMAAEQDPLRREELRLQALHLKQDIHESKDLIESIRTGTIVKTRGPWDEHAAAVLVETSRKLREAALRAQQVQAAYVRMLKKLEKLKPDEARKYWDNMPSQVIRGIYDPGGFEKAQKAIDQLYGSTMGAMKEVQQEHHFDQAIAYAEQEALEGSLRYVENLRWGCGMAVAGYCSFGMTLGTGLACGMSYEALCTGLDEGPKAAAENAFKQGAVMLFSVGVLNVGKWGIGKLINPKVVESEINTFRNILELNRYEKEAEAGRALVNQLKERVAAFQKCKAAGGKDYLLVRQQLDEAVAALNGSPLGKRFMKNELAVLEDRIKASIGASADEVTQMTKMLKECNNVQAVYTRRLQSSIYPRAEKEMISELQRHGYNVNSKWFQEFRNASSHGVNADRDLGLIQELESILTKNGQKVSLREFMDDSQKAYNSGYRQVTGQSATLADQNLTTSAHSESFPLSWLQKKVEGGTHGSLEAPVTPADFEKAGKAIYNKVKNALAGPDPAFVNMKKACASLGKDINTKVIKRLKEPPTWTTVSAESRQLALNHWVKVEKVMNDFATDKCDPLTTMRKLRELTGSTSVSESAEIVQRLMKSLGAKP